MAADESRLQPRLIALAEALRAQNRALTALTDSTEQQAEVIGSMTLVLRALLDVLLYQEQRAMLEAHLEMTTLGDHHARRSMIAAILN
jgi:hypothetical protein